MVLVLNKEMKHNFKNKRNIILQIREKNTSEYLFRFLYKKICFVYKCKIYFLFKCILFIYFFSDNNTISIGETPVAGAITVEEAL